MLKEIITNLCCLTSCLKRWPPLEPASSSMRCRQFCPPHRLMTQWSEVIPLKCLAQRLAHSKSPIMIFK